MEQINYTKTTKKYQHLKYEQRLNLEFYLKNKKKLNLTIKYISELIGVSERTIYREIKRGMVYGIKNTDLTTKNEYSAQYSQNKYKENIKSKQGYLKIGNNINLSLFIEQEIIQKKNSPYVALENAKKENYDVNICLKTLYNYIDNERFKSITSDNGSEFMDAKSIEEMGVKYYYAHSYCSGERGSNENNNKLIRRFIKKGEDISKITKKKIKEIEKWMNSYPRKMFGGKSADEIYLEYSIIPV